MLGKRFDTYSLLRKLGAPARLIRHVELVGKAADLSTRRYRSMGLVFDAQLVELGVAVHDAGKILYPAELHGPGSLHEVVRSGSAVCFNVHKSAHADCLRRASRSRRCSFKQGRCLAGINGQSAILSQ
jgi:hypothetical protein